MHVLITGATGFLGGRILKEFSEYKELTKITATGRILASENRIQKGHIQYVLGDLTDGLFVQSLFSDAVDIVVNCASLSSPWGSYKDFYTANCTTQKHLISVSIKANVKRFIYISSPSIYFNFKHVFNLNEDSPLPKVLVNQYAVTKLEAESYLKDSGLSYVTLRPRALIGEGDTVIMPRLIRSFKEGRLKIMGDGENIVDLTSVRNMVQAVWLAINTSEENCSQAYNITNSEPVNLWKSINTVLTLTGYGKIEKKVPYAVLYMIATLMEWKSRLLKTNEPILTRYSVGILSKSCTFDVQKAKSRLGYNPIQSTHEAIVEFAEWHNKNRHD